MIDKLAVKKIGIKYKYLSFLSINMKPDEKYCIIKYDMVY